MDDSEATPIETLAALGQHTDECPYLPDKVSTLHVLHGRLAAPWYRQLLDRGYRRSGGIIYRPVCAMCDACKVLRVPVARFAPTKEQRRVWRRGQERFAVRWEVPSFTEEKRALYERYLHYQHRNTEKEVEPSHYEQFLVESSPGIETLEMQFWSGETLAGVGIVDCVGDILSSVYFYFDPDFARFSPGTYSILCEIEEARQRGCPYYYLGYYIEACPAMAYKARFRPCEWKDPDGTDWNTIQTGRDKTASD